MPIYEFYCSKCDVTIEEILPIGFNDLECKKCGKKLERKMSNFSGIVKGSMNRSLDSVIGDSAEKRWNIIHKRKQDRDKARKIIKGEK